MFAISIKALAFIPLFAFASNGPNHSCEEFLKAVQAGQISKFLLSNVKDQDAGIRILTDFQLLGTEQFNQAVERALNKKGLKKEWLSQGQTTRYTKNLKSILNHWDFAEHFLIPIVLDAYLEILVSEISTPAKAFVAQRANDLIADIKSSSLPRSAFASAVREALEHTLNELNSNLDQNHLSDSDSLLRSSLDLKQPLPLAPLSSDQPNPHSIFKNNKPKIKNPPRLSDLEQPNKFNIVDVAYIGQVYVAGLRTEFNQIKELWTKELVDAKSEGFQVLKFRISHLYEQLDGIIFYIEQLENKFDRDPSLLQNLGTEQTSNIKAMLRTVLEQTKLELLELAQNSQRLSFVIIEASKELQRQRAISDSSPTIKAGLYFQHMTDPLLRLTAISIFSDEYPENQIEIIDQYFLKNYQRSLASTYLKILEDHSVSSQFKQLLFEMLKNKIKDEDPAVLRDLLKIATAQGLQIIN